MHDLAERMKPALVQVRVRRAAEPQVEGQEQPSSPEERRSAGSGFIIREDGYLVTNAHVVGDAERIQVRLSDGRRFDGKLVGLDERVDLALLKIEAQRACRWRCSATPTARGSASSCWRSAIRSGSSRPCPSAS